MTTNGAPTRPMYSWRDVADPGAVAAMSASQLQEADRWWDRLTVEERARMTADYRLWNSPDGLSASIDRAGFNGPNDYLAAVVGPQTLADALDAAAAFLRRFVAFSRPEHADVIALWAAHTHAIGRAETTGYLAVTSPEKGSGKTRTLEAVRLLARAVRPSSSSRPLQRCSG